MFLHIGEEHMIPATDVVLIGNMDSMEKSDITSEFLNISKQEGFIIDYSDGDPRSFILTGEIVYLSIISSATLQKRLNNLIGENGGY